MLTDNNQIFRNCFVIIYCHLTKVSSPINKCIIFEPNELSITLSTLCYSRLFGDDLNAGVGFLTDCREWVTWLDELKWLLTFRLTGLFRAHCATFHIHSFLLAFFPFIFNCLISILLFPCAGVRENTRAWVPLFL